MIWGWRSFSSLLYLLLAEILSEKIYKWEQNSEFSSEQNITLMHGIFKVGCRLLLCQTPPKVLQDLPNNTFPQYIILFPRSEAEGKYGLFRSQQRRLRLVAVAATRQQQCNLPSLQPAASHLDWPAERKHVGFLSARGDFAVSEWSRKMWPFWSTNVHWRWESWRQRRPGPMWPASSPSRRFCWRSRPLQGMWSPGLLYSFLWNVSRFVFDFHVNTSNNYTPLVW